MGRSKSAKASAPGRKQRRKLSIQDFVRKAEKGELTLSEARFLASDLSNEKELYQRVFAIGISGHEEFIPLLERFVFDREHLNVASEALGFLFVYNQKLEYKDVVLQFMRGVPWDDDDDLKRAAMFITGSFLSRKEDDDLLRALIREFETAKELDVRETAYTNLLRAAGLSWRDIHESKFSGPPRKLRMDVIDELKAKLAGKRL